MAIVWVRSIGSSDLVILEEVVRSGRIVHIFEGRAKSNLGIDWMWV